MQIRNYQKSYGFTLVETLLAISLFAVVVLGVVGAVYYGRQSTVLAQERVAAAMLANQGLEASRSMRDADFGNLLPGIFGLDSSGGEWVFSGTNDVTDLFTRNIEIIDIDERVKQVIATVSWNGVGKRTTDVSMTTYLSNLAANIPSGQITIDMSAASLSADRTTLQGVTLTNTGTEPATISSLVFSWIPSARRLTQITFDGSTIVWSGTQNSGNTIDITDYIVPAGATISTSWLFNGAFTASGQKTFTLEITLDDGSTATATITL